MEPVQVTPDVTSSALHLSEPSFHSCSAVDAASSPPSYSSSDCAEEYALE